MRLAVIPARGGSKRIPRKNIKLFAGQPIIAWSIQAAIESRCFDRVIVSTDDSVVAGIAQDFGAETPFVRPPELSDDYATTMAVMQHAVAWCESATDIPEAVCCIYATAPFVRARDILQGLHALHDGIDYSLTVTTYAFPIQRALRISPVGTLSMIQPEYAETRSQELEAVYHDAGQFYWGRAEAWRHGEPMFADRSAPIVLPRSRVQDIDTPEDWEHAELMFKILQSSAS